MHAKTLNPKVMAPRYESESRVFNTKSKVGPAISAAPAQKSQKRYDRKKRHFFGLKVGFFAMQCLFRTGVYQEKTRKMDTNRTPVLKKQGSLSS